MTTSHFTCRVPELDRYTTIVLTVDVSPGMSLDVRATEDLAPLDVTLGSIWAERYIDFHGAPLQVLVDPQVGVRVCPVRADGHLGLPLAVERVADAEVA